VSASPGEIRRARRVLFAHGLEGSPRGTKARYLATLGAPLRVPDMRGLPLAARVEILERVIAAGNVLLVGSSYGGLAAALVAQRHPDLLVGLVLCAPALCWAEPPNLDPATLAAPVGLPVTVLHGLRDEVVPIAASRAYRDRSGPGVRLLEVDDDHALGGSLDLVGREILSLLAGSAGRR
jgi:pimeloyl-ACP methyl ester carboxylesterase